MSGLQDAVIVEALRPVGRRRGRLAGWHPVDLAAEAVRPRARPRTAPRARFHAFALAGVDRVEMLPAPMSATRAVLRHGQRHHSGALLITGAAPA